MIKNTEEKRELNFEDIAPIVSRIVEDEINGKTALKQNEIRFGF